MKRRHFLLLSAVIGGMMSIAMFIAPSAMLNETMLHANPMAEFLMRIIAALIFCVSLINVLARRDGWSDSMKAILTGNATMHLLLLLLDGYGYVNGFVGARSVVMSGILHGSLMAAFVVMLIAPSRQDEMEVSPAR
jgi:uncharacterized membrane protein YhaH (DUF805 family)